MGRFSELDIMIQEIDFDDMTPEEAEALAAGLQAGECDYCGDEGGEPAGPEYYVPCPQCGDGREWWVGWWSRFYDFWIGDPAIEAIADEMNEWAARRRRGHLDDGLNAMKKMFEDGKLTLHEPNSSFLDAIEHFKSDRSDAAALLNSCVAQAYPGTTWIKDEKVERINLSQRCDNCGAPSDLPGLSRQKCEYCGMYFKHGPPAKMKVKKNVFPMSERCGDCGYFVVKGARDHAPVCGAPAGHPPTKAANRACHLFRSGMNYLKRNDLAY